MPLDRFKQCYKIDIVLLIRPVWFCLKAIWLCLSIYGFAYLWRNGFAYLDLMALLIAAWFVVGIVDGYVQGEREHWLVLIAFALGQTVWLMAWTVTVVFIAGIALAVQ